MSMKEPDYEYTGLMAEFWDLLRGDTSRWEDRFFYLEAVQRFGQPALDVGCGTGRILLDFLSQGIDIDGVDNSPEMLAICRRKGQRLGLQPSIYLQKMETLDLARLYRTILVPSSSFQLIIEPASVAKAMRRFYRHLLPGGWLVMSFMDLYSGDSQENVIKEQWTKEVVRPGDGAIVRRVAQSTIDRVNKLEHTRDRYEVILNGEVIAQEEHSRSPATRGYTPEESAALFTETGFTEVQLTDGFSWMLRKPESTVWVGLGKKPVKS
jgi:ubiquinone/menaquinone biosynthesis C-methylase UbiE